MQASVRADEHDLTRDLATLVRFLLTSCGRDFFQVVGELGLSLSQIKALQLLTADAEEASLKEIADGLGLSLPATSRAVEDLVRRGLVTRTADAEDRRMKRVRATGDGRALLERLTELRLAGIEGFVETLSEPERARLLAALEPIVAREEVAAVAPPPVRRRRTG